MIYEKTIRLYHWLDQNGFGPQKEELGRIVAKANIAPTSEGQVSTDVIKNLFEEESAQTNSFDVNSIKAIFQDVEEESLGNVEDQVMRRGRVVSSGESDIAGDNFIERAQIILKGLGYYNMQDGAGFFGTATKASLARFQRNNLSGTFEEGKIDRQTLIALNSPSAKREETINTESLVPRRIERSPAPPRHGEYVLPELSFVSASCANCASKARSESDKYWGNGTVKESDQYFVNSDTGEEETVESTLMKYWRYTSENNGREKNLDRWGLNGVREFGPRAGERRVSPVKERDDNGVAKDWHHWSAVFTSYIMGLHDGEGAKWFVSEAHSLYEDAFKRKRKEIERNPEDHVGKLYYLWFSKQEVDSYNISLEPGDLVGNAKHYDIYVGSGQMLGGNTCAQNEYTEEQRRNCVGTSGPKPVRFRANGGIIKRVKITGSGQIKAVT